MKSAPRQHIRYENGNTLVAASPLMRACPRCGAYPGKRCFRIVGLDVKEGVPGHQQPLLHPHAERRRHYKRREAS